MPGTRTYRRRIGLHRCLGQPLSRRLPASRKRASSDRDQPEIETPTETKVAGEPELGNQEQAAESHDHQAAPVVAMPEERGERYDQGCPTRANSSVRLPYKARSGKTNRAAHGSHARLPWMGPSGDMWASGPARRGAGDPPWAP